MNRRPNTGDMRVIPPGIALGNWYELRQSKQGPRPAEIGSPRYIHGKPYTVHVFAPALRSDEVDFYRIARHRLRAQGQP